MKSSRESERRHEQCKREGEEAENENEGHVALTRTHREKAVAVVEKPNKAETEKWCKWCKYR